MTQRWATPRDLVRSVEQHIGRPFTLDAAAEKSSTVCDRYYDRRTDGLTSPWDGVVWLNPPYRLIGPWISKIGEEVDAGRVELVASLLPARMDTRWMGEILERMWPVYLLSGRVRFCRPMPKAQRLSAPHSGNREGSVLVVAGAGARAHDIHVRPIDGIAGRWIGAKP